MTYKIGIIRGDGIGPEIIEQAIICLNKISFKYGLTFSYIELIMGGVAYDKTGNPLPQETIKAALKCDAILLGAVGGPKWDNLKGVLRPEAALLGIRKALGLYANLRPALLYKALENACPLKESIIGSGIDLVVVRELTGGIYFGEKRLYKTKDGEEAYDTEKYNESEIKRIAKVAFDLARARRFKVTNIDKANVLESSRLWRKVVHNVHKDYADVTLCDMFVDNAAMQLVRDPGQFDVILTSNMFGDILSDEAAMITGSIGILPSASMGKTAPFLYEPIHGSAPDIANQNIANPIATILSAAMMLRNSFKEENAAKAIENAVNTVLLKGYRTADIGNQNIVSTSKMGELISSFI
ncbi:MAG: 3-isopropylmalate dehydrogenase [Clostridia bacterium]